MPGRPHGETEDSPLMKIPNRDAREAAAFDRLAALDTPDQAIWVLFGTAVIARDVQLAEQILDSYEDRILRKRQEATR